MEKTKQKITILIILLCLMISLLGCANSANKFVNIKNYSFEADSNYSHENLIFKIQNTNEYRDTNCLIFANKEKIQTVKINKNSTIFQNISLNFSKTESQLSYSLKCGWDD